MTTLKMGLIQAMRNMEVGGGFMVDMTVDPDQAPGFDALVLPGGVLNPDRLRMAPEAVGFVRAFVRSGKPAAAICHAPWLLVETDVVRGRTLTSSPSLRTDIQNAGGIWLDEPVHVDQGLVTSRRPEDLTVFRDKLLEEIGEGQHVAVSVGGGDHA